MADSSRYDDSTPVETTRAEGTAGTANANSPQPAQPAHLRSCVLCRQRKVKCDRRQPCSNCIRARASCVHPPGAGRAAKRPRQPVDTKVLDRLSQLETTIRRLQKQTKDREADPHVASELVRTRENGGLVEDDTPQPAETAPELGRLVVDESQSRYVSNVMWADLTESIEQLRGMFLDSNSRDDDSNQPDDSPPFHDADSPTAGSLGSNAAILGYRSVAGSLRDLHPPLELSMRLFQIFTDNVLPVVRIFHMPTLMPQFWSAAMSLDSLDRDTEALLFAIYYSAVISIDSLQCADMVGAPRPVAVERYKFAAEQALARANLLSTHSSLLLQAAVLYLSALRSDDGTRAVWSLIALVSHVARSMGYHRDGTVFNLPPLETEMRRRIWHLLVMLDNRSTEYHGHEPPLWDNMAFDTRWPLNINDSDISSDMTEPPPESDGATEMILVQVRCQALRVSQQVKRASHLPFRDRVRLVDEHDKWVEKYLERCDPTQSLQYLAMEICAIAAARIRVVLYYSELMARKRKKAADASHTSNMDKSSESASPSVSEVELDSEILREHMFAGSIIILERMRNIMLDSRLDRWAWHAHIYVQWPTLALVLSEICIRPPSPQCDKAWEYATAVYDRWLSVKYRDRTEQGDEFVKPMGQLIAKAQRVREMQRAGPQQRHVQTPTQMLIQNPGTRENIPPRQQTIYDTSRSKSSSEFNSVDTIHMNPRPHPSNLNSTATSMTPIPIHLSGNDLRAYDINDIEAFLGILPDELQEEWFEAVGQDSTGTRNDSTETASTRPFFNFA
ncbi:fungal-specific transcription factor domain-containing protein [Nemania sp. NC0429]|nr:fungal-specific transcription factor domain-containing protein [Nemania sp. NC0429]